MSGKYLSIAKEIITVSEVCAVKDLFMIMGINCDVDVAYEIAAIHRAGHMEGARTERAKRRKGRVAA